MINSVQVSADVGDAPDQRSRRQRSEADDQPQPLVKPAVSEPDVRLVIEQDEVRGGLTYKRIDRATGEVVSEVTRDDLLRMSADPHYTAGRVISTKA